MSAAMFLEENRVASFKKWPFSARSKCSAKKMAMAGFYFCGSAESEDNVKCFMCGKELDGWDPKDDPMKEHKKHSALCPFLSLDIEDNRLKTFATWDQSISSFPASEFARAGFVHAPSLEDPDNVFCFACNKYLSGWEPTDDPFTEHRSHSRTCKFIWSLPPDTHAHPLADPAPGPAAPAASAPAPVAAAAAASAKVGRTTKAAKEDRAETGEQAAPATAARDEGRGKRARTAKAAAEPVEDIVPAASQAPAPAPATATATPAALSARPAPPVDGVLSEAQASTSSVSAPAATGASAVASVAKDNENSAPTVCSDTHDTQSSLPSLRDPAVQDMTVEQYLKTHFEAQGLAMTRLSEEHIKKFQHAASEKRRALQEL